MNKSKLLPDGYRVEASEDCTVNLVSKGDKVVARIDEDGRLKLGYSLLGGSLDPEHFSALVALLLGAR